MNELLLRKFFADMDITYSAYTAPPKDGEEQVNGFQVVQAVLEHTKQVLLNSVVQGQQLEVLSIITHAAEAVEGAKQGIARIVLAPPAVEEMPAEPTEFEKAAAKHTRKGKK